MESVGPQAWAVRRGVEAALPIEVGRQMSWWILDIGGGGLGEMHSVR